MLAADYEEPSSSYWRETEFYLVDILRWRVLNETLMVPARDTVVPSRVLSGWKTDVDLSRVDEIGVTDLARGGGRGTQASSGLDWIEVHGNSVSRSPAQSEPTGAEQQ